jgi:hypothetical protein
MVLKKIEQVEMAVKKTANSLSVVIYWKLAGPRGFGKKWSWRFSNSEIVFKYKLVGYLKNNSIQALNTSLKFGATVVQSFEFIKNP